MKARLYSIVYRYLRDLCALSREIFSYTLRFDRPMNSLYRMKHRVDRFFVSDELRKRYLRECVFDYLVQADDDRPDAAIAIVNA